MKIVIAFKQKGVGCKAIFNKDNTVDIVNITDENIIKNILDGIKNLDVIEDEKNLIEILKEANITFLNIYINEGKDTKNYIVKKAGGINGPEWITELKESKRIMKRGITHRDIKIETEIMDTETEKPYIKKEKFFITKNNETVVKEVEKSIEEINKIKKEKFSKIVKNLMEKGLITKEEEKNETKVERENILTVGF